MRHLDLRSRPRPGPRPPAGRADPGHPRAAREAGLQAPRLRAAPGPRPPGRAQERHGGLHRRGPRAAPRQPEPHPPRGALLGARGQGGAGRPHRQPPAPRGHEAAHRRAARRALRLPGRPGLLRDLRHRGSAGLNCLRDNLDESLALFVEMLKEPRFQEDRLALAKEQALQEMKKRNDEAGTSRAGSGACSSTARAISRTASPPRPPSRAITRDDLAAFHRQWYHPANMVAAVSGSFTRAEMVARAREGVRGAGPRPARGARRCPPPSTPPPPASTASRRT